VILDEPFSGLDPLGRRHMLTWIKKLKDKQTSIILCTHELWSMYHLCDDFHILRRGALAYSTLDHPSGHDANPQDIGQRWFLNFSGPDHGALQTMQTRLGLPQWEDCHHEGFLAKLQFGNYEDATAWLMACHGAGHAVLKFEGAKGQLEDRILEYFDGGNV
jgi:ABC-2 type transport system ATP-binding protein